MSNLFSRQLFRIYFIVVLVLMTLPLNKSGSLNHIYVIKIRGDYFFHALIFLPWAFFGPFMKKNPWLWFVFGLLFAVGSELLHYLIPYRRFNINDILSNSIGIILGFATFIPLGNKLKYSGDD
jgi:glycopeptide antibiotics resistance protein